MFMGRISCYRSALDAMTEIRKGVRCDIVAADTRNRGRLPVFLRLCISRGMRVSELKPGSSEATIGKGLLQRCLSATADGEVIAVCHDGLTGADVCHGV